MAENGQHEPFTIGDLLAGKRKNLMTARIGVKLDLVSTPEHQRDDGASTANAADMISGALFFCALPDVFERFRKFMIDMAMSDPPEPDRAHHYSHLDPAMLMCLGDAMEDAENLEEPGDDQRP